MNELSVPAVFSTMLKALLLLSHVETSAPVALKFIGEFTSNVTSAVVPGTLAGTAANVTASGTCQRRPEITLACTAKAENSPIAAKAATESERRMLMPTPVYWNLRPTKA